MTPKSDPPRWGRENSQKTRDPRSKFPRAEIRIMSLGDFDPILTPRPHFDPPKPIRGLFGAGGFRCKLGNLKHIHLILNK